MTFRVRGMPDSPPWRLRTRVAHPRVLRQPGATRPKIAARRRTWARPLHTPALSGLLPAVVSVPRMYGTSVAARADRGAGFEEPRPASPAPALRPSRPGAARRPAKGPREL